MKYFCQCRLIGKDKFINKISACNFQHRTPKVPYKENIVHSVTFWWAYTGEPYTMLISVWKMFINTRLKLHAIHCYSALLKESNMKAQKRYFLLLSKNKSVYWRTRFLFILFNTIVLFIYKNNKILCNVKQPYNSWVWSNMFNVHYCSKSRKAITKIWIECMPK